MTKQDPGFGGLYKQFKTDKTLENKGVELNYGDFRITIARAGGANKQFSKVLSAKSKPFRRAIQTETMNDDRAMELLMETYAASVILNWETKVNGKFQVGIEPSEGDKLLPFTVENVILTLTNLPDLFMDVQEQATRVAIFREDILEAEAGN